MVEDRDVPQSLKPTFETVPFACDNRSLTLFLPGIEHLTNLEVRMASMDQSSDPEREDENTNPEDQAWVPEASEQDNAERSDEQVHAQVEEGEALSPIQRIPNTPPPSYPTPPPRVTHAVTGKPRGESGLADFITHYRNELQQGKIRPGWQQNVRLEERAQFALQHYNSYRLLEPNVTGETAMHASTSLEGRLFISARSREQYFEFAQQKLLKLVEKLGQFAEQDSSSQNTPGSRGAQHALQVPREDPQEESSRAAQQESSALPDSHFGLPIPQDPHLACQDLPEYTTQQNAPKYTAQPNAQGPVRAQSAAEYHQMRKASRGPGNAYGENACWWVKDRLEYRRLCRRDRREEQLAQRNNNQSDLEAQHGSQENGKDSRGCWASFVGFLNTRSRHFADRTLPDPIPSPAGGLYKISQIPRIAPRSGTDLPAPHSRPEIMAEGRAIVEAIEEAERNTETERREERARNKWYRRMFHPSREPISQDTDVEAQPTSLPTPQLSTTTQDQEPVATQPMSEILSQGPISTLNQERNEPMSRVSFHIDRPLPNEDLVENQPGPDIVAQAFPSTQAQDPTTPQSVSHTSSPVAAAVQDQDLESTSPPRQVSPLSCALRRVRRFRALRTYFRAYARSRLDSLSPSRRRPQRTHAQAVRWRTGTDEDYETNNHIQMSSADHAASYNYLVSNPSTENLSNHPYQHHTRTTTTESGASTSMSTALTEASSWQPGHRRNETQVSATTGSLNTAPTNTSVFTDQRSHSLSTAPTNASQHQETDGLNRPTPIKDLASLPPAPTHDPKAEEIPERPEVEQNPYGWVAE
jgi:hypothetical protein